MPERDARVRKARASACREWTSSLGRLGLVAGQLLLPAALPLAQMGVRVAAVSFVRTLGMLASADFVEVGIDVDVLAHVALCCERRAAHWSGGGPPPPPPPARPAGRGPPGG